MARIVAHVEGLGGASGRDLIELVLLF